MRLTIIKRPNLALPLFYCASAVQSVRFARYEAFGANLDPEEVAEARSWHSRFSSDQLPKGNVTYARSSGPGGQHVNKTETKAITTWPVHELVAVLPKFLHSKIRTSKYYTAGSDCLTFHAQTQRSRSANTEENRQKLTDEILRIYREVTPNETSSEKVKKHRDVETRFHETRLRGKKFSSAKKQSRRGPVD